MLHQTLWFTSQSIQRKFGSVFSRSFKEHSPPSAPERTHHMQCSDLPGTLVEVSDERAETIERWSSRGMHQAQNDLENRLRSVHLRHRDIRSNAGLIARQDASSLANITVRHHDHRE